MSPMESIPSLPAFLPERAWPPKVQGEFKKAAQSNKAVALVGGPGAPFTAGGIWFLRLALSTAGSGRFLDLACLTRRDRLQAWERTPPFPSWEFLHHAELVPSSKWETGHFPGRVASFLGIHPGPTGWVTLPLPRLADYPRLTERIQEAWWDLTGLKLPVTRARQLAQTPWMGGEAELVETLVWAAAKGAGFRHKPTPPPAPIPSEGTAWRVHKNRLEKALIEGALRESGGNRTRAARALGVHRNTLLWHLRKRS